MRCLLLVLSNYSFKYNGTVKQFLKMINELMFFGAIFQNKSKDKHMQNETQVQLKSLRHLCYCNINCFFLIFYYWYTEV